MLATINFWLYLCTNKKQTTSTIKTYNYEKVSQCLSDKRFNNDRQ